MAAEVWRVLQQSQGKYDKNKKYLYLGIILVFYFLSRLINLNSLPVFGDEAIYVRWAQIIKSVDTLRFIPLTDGKQPLLCGSMLFS